MLLDEVAVAAVVVSANVQRPRFVAERVAHRVSQLCHTNPSAIAHMQSRCLPLWCKSGFSSWDARADPEGLVMGRRVGSVYVYTVLNEEGVGKGVRPLSRKNEFFS